MTLLAVRRTGRRHVRRQRVGASRRRPRSRGAGHGRGGGARAGRAGGDRSLATPGGRGPAAAGRRDAGAGPESTEIALADIPVAGPGGPAPHRRPAGEHGVYAGRTEDGAADRRRRASRTARPRLRLRRSRHRGLADGHRRRRHAVARGARPGGPRRPGRWAAAGSTAWRPSTAPSRPTRRRRPTWPPRPGTAGPTWARSCSDWAVRMSGRGDHEGLTETIPRVERWPRHRPDRRPPWRRWPSPTRQQRTAGGQRHRLVPRAGGAGRATRRPGSGRCWSRSRWASWSAWGSGCTAGCTSPRSPRLSVAGFSSGSRRSPGWARRRSRWRGPAGVGDADVRAARTHGRTALAARCTAGPGGRRCCSRCRWPCTASTRSGFQDGIAAGARTLAGRVLLLRRCSSAKMLVLTGSGAPRWACRCSAGRCSPR